MFKPSVNPKLLELVKTHKARRINASDIVPTVIDGVRLCAYCGENPIIGHRAKKYCSKICQFSLYAWCEPQKESSLAVLLARQGYKCATCGYDWNPLAESLIAAPGINKKLNRFTEYSLRLIKRLKRTVDKDRKPEVDHLIPISKGGQSIGLENVRAICNTCHKAKTKIDNSGKRLKNKV